MKLRDALEGLSVRADGGFTCLEAGSVRTVHVDEKGLPWIKCSQGRHYLVGQLCDEDGTLSGLERVYPVFNRRSRIA